MATRIFVTTDDLENAGRNRIWYNPVARAVQRALRDENAAVTRRAVHLTDRGVYTLPEHASRWVGLWDEGDEPSPFSFELPI